MVTVMDISIPFHTAPSAPDCDIVVLRCHACAPFDRAALARVFADQPLSEAEDMLCRILENIAYWLDILQQDSACDPGAMAGKAARRISLVAGQIGLVGLAVAADHVGRCLKAGDDVALAATIGRLERAFDLAVSEVWTFRDL